MTGLAALVLAIVSCGIAVAAPRTVPVTAGPLFQPRNVDRLADALGFFPSAVTIHAGDDRRGRDAVLVGRDGTASDH